MRAVDEAGPHPGAERRAVVSPALVGRTGELARLVSGVTTPPAVVVVEGEAGVGKSRLVSELPSQAGLAGWRLLWGGCRPIREAFPLGPLLEAVLTLPDSSIDNLSPVAGALRPLLPELAERLPPAPRPLDDRTAERHRTYRGLVALLDAVTPAVLVLEDLHWADGQTRDFVRYLLGNPPAGLSLVVTLRAEEVDPLTRAAIGDNHTSVSWAELALTPLDVGHSGALAAAIMGVEEVPEEFAAYLYERTGGLPFAVEEVVALLRERGVVIRPGGEWARRALDELQVPAAIREHIRERASRLPATAPPVLETAAVLQRAAPDWLITAVAARPSGEVATALTAAITAGVLVEQPAGIAFRHTLAAQAIYQDTPGPRRRELHARAAAALRGLVPPPLGQIAHHLRRTGQLASWADAAEQAADQAVALGHHDEAARLLEELLREAPLEPHRRGRLAVQLGWAVTQMLHPTPVTDLLARVVEEPDLPAPVRGELRLLLAVGLDRVADAATLRRLFTGAIDDLGSRPDLRAWATVGMALRSSPGRVSERVEWLDRALEIVPELTGPFRVHLLGKITAGLAHVGDPRWRELTSQIEQATGGQPQHEYEVNAYWSVGQAACFIGCHDYAATLLTSGQAGAAATASDRLQTLLRSSLLLVDYCRGAWDGLDAAARSILEHLADIPRARPAVELVAGCVALARGDVDAAHARLNGLLDEFAGHDGSSDVLPAAVAPLIRLALIRGDVDTAMGYAERMLAAREPDGYPPAMVRALPATTAALLAAGRVETADALVGEWDLAMRSLDAPVAAAAIPHARGLQADTEGRTSAAAEQLEAAATHYDRLASPYEAAQAREAAAVALLGAGEPAAPESILTALATYQRLGANWDINRVMYTAREHGVSVPTRHRRGRRGYGDQLSPREQEVAELAAKGRSNKQIAQELFLSPETVKKHVRTVMRKLDVPSRAALAYRLAGGEPDSV